jgi:hypothetical protein
MEYLMTPGPDIIRIYNHTHFVQVQGKKTLEGNDGKATVGLISGLAWPS